MAPAFPACCFEVFVFFPAARNEATSRGGGDAGAGAGRALPGTAGAASVAAAVEGEAGFSF